MFGTDHVVQYAFPSLVRVRVQKIHVSRLRIGRHVAVGHRGTAAAHERHFQFFLERRVQYPPFEAAGHARQLPYVQLGGHVHGLVELARVVGRHPRREDRLRHRLFDEQDAQRELLRDVGQHPEHGQTGGRMAVQPVLDGFGQSDEVLVQREHFENFGPVVFARTLRTFLFAGRAGFFGHYRRVGDIRNRRAYRDNSDRNARRITWFSDVKTSIAFRILFKIPNNLTIVVLSAIKMRSVCQHNLQTVPSTQNEDKITRL